MRQDHKKQALSDVRVLCAAALLCALSVVIGWLCKTYLTFTVLGNGVRFTLENLPIILSGLWFGPAVGAAVGFASDIVSTCVSQFGPGGINPLVTLGATAVGLTAGAVSRLFARAGRPVRDRRVIFCAVFSAHALGSGLCKTLGLYLYHFYAAVTVGSVTFSSLWLRLPTYLVIAAIECYLCCLLIRNPAISTLTERIRS